MPLLNILGHSRVEKIFERTTNMEVTKFTRAFAGQKQLDDKSYDDPVRREEFQKLLGDQRKLLSETEIGRDRLEKA